MLLFAPPEELHGRPGDHDTKKPEPDTHTPMGGSQPDPVPDCTSCWPPFAAAFSSSPGVGDPFSPQQHANSFGLSHSLSPPQSPNPAALNIEVEKENQSHHAGRFLLPQQHEDEEAEDISVNVATVPASPTAHGQYHFFQMQEFQFQGTPGAQKELQLPPASAAGVNGVTVTSNKNAAHLLQLSPRERVMLFEPRSRVVEYQEPVENFRIALDPYGVLHSLRQGLKIANGRAIFTAVFEHQHQHAPPVYEDGDTCTHFIAKPVRVSQLLLPVVSRELDAVKKLTLRMKEEFKRDRYARATCVKVLVIDATGVLHGVVVERLGVPKAWRGAAEQAAEDDAKNARPPGNTGKLQGSAGKTSMLSTGASLSHGLVFVTPPTDKKATGAGTSAAPKNASKNVLQNAFHGKKTSSPTAAEFSPRGRTAQVAARSEARLRARRELSAEEKKNDWLRRNRGTAWAGPGYAPSSSSPAGPGPAGKKMLFVPAGAVQPLKRATSPANDVVREIEAVLSIRTEEGIRTLNATKSRLKKFFRKRQARHQKRSAPFASQLSPLLDDRKLFFEDENPASSMGTLMSRSTKVTSYLPLRRTNGSSVLRAPARSTNGTTGTPTQKNRDTIARRHSLDLATSLLYSLPGPVPSLTIDGRVDIFPALLPKAGRVHDADPSTCVSPYERQQHEKRVANKKSKFRQLQKQAATPLTSYAHLFVVDNLAGRVHDIVDVSAACPCDHDCLSPLSTSGIVHEANSNEHKKARFRNYLQKKRARLHEEQHLAKCSLREHVKFAVAGAEGRSAEAGAGDYKGGVAAEEGKNAVYPILLAQTLSPSSGHRKRQFLADRREKQMNQTMQNSTKREKLRHFGIADKFIGMIGTASSSTTKSASSAAEIESNLDSEGEQDEEFCFAS